MRIGSVSGIAGRGDSSLIRPVPDAETLPFNLPGYRVGFEVKLTIVMATGNINRLSDVTHTGVMAAYTLGWKRRSLDF